MAKVISGHIKTEVPVHHEIIAECKLEVLSFQMLSAWVKHQMVVDVNIQGLSYVKNSAVCTEFPMPSKFNFSQWKTYFPNYIFDKFFN